MTNISGYLPIKCAIIRPRWAVRQTPERPYQPTTFDQYPICRPRFRFHHTQGRIGVWSYTVRALTYEGETVVVFTDSCRGYPDRIPPNLYGQAIERGLAAAILMSSGHRFKYSWSEVVDRAEPL